MHKKLACLALALGYVTTSYAQSTSANSGTIRGSVLDPSGAAIPAPRVEIQNPVSHYDKERKTERTGKLRIRQRSL